LLDIMLLWQCQQAHHSWEPGPTICPYPFVDGSLDASGVLCPLPWPNFPCEGDGKHLTSSGSLQPKPPWVYTSQDLFSKGPRCWEHLYFSGNLNLLAGCWNFSSPELPLYGNDLFMGYSATDCCTKKSWDPGGMLKSGCAPIAFPRCFCLLWDSCLTEANHSMEHWAFTSLAQFERQPILLHTNWTLES
jgi:hypothetical protein